MKRDTARPRFGLSWQSACLPTPGPRSNLQTRMAEQTYNLNTQELEVDRSEAQGHPWLHREFKVSLGCINSIIKGERDGEHKDSQDHQRHNRSSSCLQDKKGHLTKNLMGKGRKPQVCGGW